MKIFGIVLACLVLMLGLGWITQGNDFLLYRFFAPKEEAVRREVFKESQAYNDGMQQELYAMQRDYVMAKTPEQKAAIKSMVLHRVSTYDISKLPSDLRIFILQLRTE